MSFYVINTDRNAIDPVRKAEGLSTSDLWFEHYMAFAGDNAGERGKHAAIFKKLEKDDIIFMYHSTSGYVGVGKVLNKWDEIIYEGSNRLLYTDEIYEYRIPVHWIYDFRQNPLKSKHGLPQQRGKSWHEIDEERFPAVLLFSQDYSIKPLTKYEEDLNNSVEKSLRDKDDTRKKRLAHASTKPKRVAAIVTVYKRNPDVVAEVLKRANGTCELCGKPAPFIRESDGSPYLEVHHIQQLALGGLDTESNALALCPNCHRKEHFGKK